MAAYVDTAVASRVDEAIVQVLQAEQSARDTVTQCAVDAERVREHARARAHAIAERAAERAARVHRWTDAAIGARVQSLNSERIALQLPPPPDPAEPVRLGHALDLLAAELTTDGKA